MSQATANPAKNAIAAALAPTGHAHPLLVAAEDTARCGYCKNPSTMVRTGQQGNRFGLCDTCGAGHMALVAAEREGARQHTAITRPADEVAFSAALDAIEAAFAVSKHPERTRRALRNAVDAYAAEARA